MSALEALEKIAGEAPWKPPNASPSVAWPPNWSDDLRDTVNDMILDAFREGFDRALWESGQIADEALKAATGERVLVAALEQITEMDGDQPARSDWDMVRIARAALKDAP